jgi:tetratricopeptide (TPR) repeat protein
MTLDPQTDEMLRDARRLADLARIPEAIATYLRVLTRRPDLTNAWYNLALLQRKVGEFAAALGSYQQALTRRIARPEEVHLNRAVIFSDDLRQPEAAERELAAALELNPSYVPALLNLANLHEDLGRRDAARQTYERVLRLDPSCMDGLARYANLTRFADPSDPLIGRLRDAVRHSRASAAERASLGFALGRALDACGDYDEAFRAYAAANQNSRASAGTAGASYDRSGWERLVDRLITAFPTAPTAVGSGIPRPIFVCGMFRSGSTLTEQLLAGHPRITPGGELDLLPRLAQRVLTSFPDTIASAPAGLLADAAAHYGRALAGLFPGAELVTDKRPDNFTLIGLIKYLFPDAKIVHTMRDPLDNCLSIFFLHLDHRMSYALDLMDIGHYYRHYLRLMAHWKRLFGPDIFDVRYDTLVRGPRGVMEPLLRFLGIEWDERCLEVAPSARAIRTASVWQVREPLYQRSSGRAQHYEEQLAPLRAYLADLCEEGK